MAILEQGIELSQREGSVGDRGGLDRRRRWWRSRLVWLGALPFLAYVAIFLIIPAIEVVIDAFRGAHGGFTFSNVDQLFKGQYLNAYETSIKISAMATLTGGVLGFFIGLATFKGGIPRWLRTVVTTFSGVAANFAGIPLAFAFVATIGTTGIVTQFLTHFGVHLAGSGFKLYGFWGLVIVYTYFQFPLMLLILAPSLEGIRDQWREANDSLGGGSFTFWRYIGMPVLGPSVLSAMVLLFGSAFSAYATPYALTSGYINLVPVLIGSVLSGNVLAEPQLGDALSLGMIVVVMITVAIYVLLQRRVARWTR